MLTDTQMIELSRKMDVPLVGCFFKDTLPKLEYNKSYVVNLQDEYNEDGTLNSGSHWTCFQIQKYPNGVVEGLYFDPTGVAPPTDVIKAYKKLTKKEHFPYNTKDIQSALNNACGWYCLAYLHYINAFSHRSKNLYDDTDTFLSFFDDLNKSADFKKNEYILKQFFQPKDPKLRKEIDVFGDGIDRIVNDDCSRIDLTKV
jgi:hypothetical protein